MTEVEIVKEIRYEWFWNYCPEATKAAVIGISIAITIQIVFKLIFLIKLRRKNKKENETN